MRTLPIGRRWIITTLACLTTTVAGSSFAQLTPEAKCQAGMNNAAGKYAACLGKAEKALAANGDAIAYAAAVTKCEGKLATMWDKFEAGAVAAGTACPSVTDQLLIDGFLASCSESVATAIAGGPLGPDPLTCAADLATCDSDLATCDDERVTCEADLAVAESDLATCDGDLATCQASTSRIARTGQTTCSNDAGTPIPCAGSGLDGQYQAGDAPSFVDNGNGTITDNLTGLMWEKLSDDGSIHDYHTQFAGLTAAIAKATTLNGMAFAGHTDWRVPNLRELASIPVYGSVYSPAVPSIFHTGCVGGCTVLTCSCTRNNVYISSTTYHGYQPACWKVNMQDGDIYAGDKTDTHFVRLVRTAH